MTRDDVQNAVAHALGEVAPEADPATLKPEVPFREQLDIDSMDLLRFVIALHEMLASTSAKPTTRS